MKTVFISILFLSVLSSGFSQSKMRIIKNKVKKKVEHYDELQKQEIEAAKSAKNVRVISSEYSEDEFLRDYKYDDDDEIPWNATITVYDGRVLDEIPEFNIVEEVMQDDPRQLYQAYPLEKDFFIDPYIGSPVFSKLRFSYGYSSADSVNLYDFEALAAYEMFSLNIKHQMLRFSNDVEFINFSFSSISPGIIFSLPDRQSYLQIFAGIGFFNIDADDETLVDGRIDRTFSGINIGASLSTFLAYQITFDAKVDFTAVKYDNEIDNYFMNFLLSEFSLGYVYERFGFQLGIKYQEFRDIDIENPTNTFLLKEPFFGIYSYF